MSACFHRIYRLTYLVKQQYRILIHIYKPNMFNFCVHPFVHTCMDIQAYISFMHIFTLFCYYFLDSCIRSELILILFAHIYGCRSYYRCTHQGCNVKKQVQRLSRDEGVVVTTYEGTHTHPIEKSNDNFEHILTQMQIYTGMGSTFSSSGHNMFH